MQNAKLQNSELVIGKIVKDISEHRTKNRCKLKEKLEDKDSMSRIDNVHLIKHPEIERSSRQQHTGHPAEIL